MRSNLCFSAEDSRDVENGGVHDAVETLPPSPEPDHYRRCAQAACGTFLAVFCLVMFVAPMQAYVSSMDLTEVTSAMRLLLFAQYAEASVALYCFLRLMNCDPGTCKRTPDHCFPQPEAVAERLRCFEWCCREHGSGVLVLLSLTAAKQHDTGKKLWPGGTSCGDCLPNTE